MVMQIYVMIKQVPATDTKIKLTGDAIDQTGITQWIISPYDDLAIEEALRLREKNPGSKVTIISAGPQRVTDSLRLSLALGADTAVRIDLPDNADASMVAKAITHFLKKEPEVSILFCGKEAIDDGASTVGALVARLMGMPFINVVQSITYEGTKLSMKRDSESIEVLEVDLPVVIGAQKGLSELRYASIPNILKAKNKEIRVISDHGVSESDRRIKLDAYALPPAKQSGKKILGEPALQARELARYLHEEAKVL